jgi:hypothetical protein
MRQNSVSQLLASTVNNLGRCPGCIRRSFVTAAWAWLAVMVFEQFTHSIFVILPVWIVASSFTALWMAHVAVFAVRRSGTFSVNLEGNAEILNRERRAVLPIFAKALIASAVVATLPKPGRARDASDGDSDDKCMDKCDSQKEKCISDCGDEPPGGGDPQTPEEARRWEEWFRCGRRCRKDWRSCTDECQ